MIRGRLAPLVLVAVAALAACERPVARPVRIVLSLAGAHGRPVHGLDLTVALPTGTSVAHEPATRRVARGALTLRAGARDAAADATFSPHATTPSIRLLLASKEPLRDGEVAALGLHRDVVGPPAPHALRGCRLGRRRPRRRDGAGRDGLGERGRTAVAAIAGRSPRVLHPRSVAPFGPGLAGGSRMAHLPTLAPVVRPRGWSPRLVEGLQSHGRVEAPRGGMFMHGHRSFLVLCVVALLTASGCGGGGGDDGGGDETAPTVTITAPAAGSVQIDGSVTVTGTVSDDSGALASAAWSVDGGDWTSVALLASAPLSWRVGPGHGDRAVLDLDAPGRRAVMVTVGAVSSPPVGPHPSAAA